MNDATKQLLTLLMNVKSSRMVYVDSRVADENPDLVSIYFEPTATKAGRTMPGFNYLISKDKFAEIWWGEVNSNMGYIVKG